MVVVLCPGIRGGAFGSSCYLYLKEAIAEVRGARPRAQRFQVNGPAEVHR